MKRLVLLAPVAAGAAALAAALSATSLTASDTGPGLERFRAAYLAGTGLTYVVIAGESGERVYRYGDVSRDRAKQDGRRYWLFTCLWRHIFETDRVSHRVALAGAKVVHAGEPGFDALDARYLSGCSNPYVRSAKRSEGSSPAPHDTAVTPPAAAPTAQDAASNFGTKTEPRQDKDE